MHDPDSNDGDNAPDGTSPPDQSHHPGGGKQSTDEHDRHAPPRTQINITINNEGKEEVKIHPGDPEDDPMGTSYTHQDPVRNIRISPADIPRMQSRMSG